MPLRLRLVLLFVAGTGVVIAVVGVVFLTQMRAGLNASLDASLQTRANALVARLDAGQELRPKSEDSSAPSDSSDTADGPSLDEVQQVFTLEGQMEVQFSSEPDDSCPWSDEACPLLTPAQAQQARQGGQAYTVLVDGHHGVRVVAMAALHGHHPVVVVVGASTYLINEAMSRVRWVIVLGGPVAVVLAGAGAWLLAGAALRPVERMRRQVASISEHDGETRLALPGTRDEITALAVTMNELLDRLQRALARQRGFVADAGHELRTPLTALKVELELAARPGRSHQALAAAISAAATDTDRLIRLAEDLLLLARADEGSAFVRPAPLVLPELVRAAVQGICAQAAARNVSVAVEAGPPLALSADADRLRQAVGNLLDNALRYAPPGSGVAVKVSTGARSGGEVAVVEVRDHGPGFPPEFLPLAFERFRRADSARSRDQGGTGLGLAIVQSIARAHGGQAGADNHPGGGARVWLEIPLQRSALARV
jgi:two-component system, OmpR family, sensor kinase